MRKDRKKVKPRKSLKTQAPLPCPCGMLPSAFPLTWKRLPVVWSCFATVCSLAGRPSGRRNWRSSVNLIQPTLAPGSTACGSACVKWKVRCPALAWCPYPRRWQGSTKLLWKPALRSEQGHLGWTDGTLWNRKACLHTHLKDMGRRPELSAAEQMSIKDLVFLYMVSLVLLSTKTICSKKLWAEGTRQFVNNSSMSVPWFLHLVSSSSPHSGSSWGLLFLVAWSWQSGCSSV